MLEYVVSVVIISFCFVVCLVKKFIFDYDIYVEEWSKSSDWLPSEEDETLEKALSVVPKSGSECMTFCGGDNHGHLIVISMRKLLHNVAQIKCNLCMDNDKKLEILEQSELLPCEEWTCKDISFEMLEVFDSWRIVINTIMKCGNDFLHVNIKLIWRSTSSPIYLYENNSRGLIYSIEKRNDVLRGYDQYGILSGNVMIDGIESVIHLLSLRHRDWHELGQVYVKSDYEQMFTVFLHDGLYTGHFHKVNNAIDIINSSNTKLEDSIYEVTIPTPTGSKLYTLNPSEIQNHFNREGVHFSFRLKSDDLVGTIPSISLLDIPDPSKDFIINLKSPLSRKKRFVGGKASNLSILTFLSIMKQNSLKANVPDGFCLTVEAYRKHLMSNPTLSKVIAQLDSVHDDDLELKCQRIQNMWNLSRLDNDVESALSKHLEDKIYAVRSSGIEEDLNNISAAGQNESILGVTGCARVAQSILMCWGSLFSYQSVQYRRKNGLRVSTSEMCILIQELVSNVQTSGVLITCDPVSGHPWTCVISSNFGLGLSVVSASCDPDTFSLKRDFDGDFSIKQKKCGLKQTKTIFSGQDIQDVTLSTEENSSYSLSDTNAKVLAKLGFDIKQLFGFECDIEWVLDQNNHLHIVQVRPVTSILCWTEYELIHEFDSPIQEGYDALTFHNIGETCPGSLCPMNISIFKMLNEILQENLKPVADKNVRLTNTLYFCYRGALNLMNTLLFMEDNKTSQIVFCGQVITTPEIHHLFVTRNGVPAQSKIFKIMLNMIRNMIKNKSNCIKAAKISEEFQIEVSDNPQEMFSNLCSAFNTLKLIAFYHLLSSGISCLFQRVLIDILIRNESSDVSSDSLVFVANSIINSVNNVVSVDIPLHFQELVKSIIIEDMENMFTSIDPSDGEEWLKQHCPTSYNLLQTFIDKHGHRGNHELSFTSETWSMNKPKLIDIIRGMVQNKLAEPLKTHTKTVQYGLSNQMVKSKIVKYLMPFARTAVTRREMTKNALVLALHKVRLAFLHLASILCKKGLLPEPKLIFYLSLYELKQVVHNETTNFVNKAARREKLQERLDKLTFSSQSIGRPNALRREPKLLSIGKQLKGSPVWPGVVLGRAHVILNLEDAGQIQSGDILVTHGTDTGWTPYFTMLGGLVTELGGILSHGAVVAREYGLPSIVGVEDATFYFKTGDQLLLNSTKGTIEKVMETKCSEDTVPNYQEVQATI